MEIKKDQLEKIQGFQKDLNKLLNEVGFLEAQKTSVLGKFHEVNKETEDFKKELEEEYGSIIIPFYPLFFQLEYMFHLLN